MIVSKGRVTLRLATPAMVPMSAFVNVLCCTPSRFALALSHS